ncbi:MAG: hypothetical protein K0S79_1127 [Nitrospira sp.]|nr:hypothetical protein [Nitrospira sp.]
MGGRCVDGCSQELGDGQLTAKAIRTVLQNRGFSVTLQPVLRRGVEEKTMGYELGGCLGRNRSRASERASRSYCSPPLKSVTGFPFLS